MVVLYLEDLKYGIYKPLILELRDKGPLYDGFFANNTKIVTIYSNEKKIDIFNFWS